MFDCAQVLKSDNVCFAVTSTTDDLTQLDLADRYFVALASHDDTRLKKTYNPATRKWSDEP